MSTKPPAPQPGNVYSFPKPRRRDETRSYEAKQAPAYAPPPGETFGLFKVNELEAQEILQPMLKPITAAFIVLRGTVEELVRDASGTLVVIREIEAGELLNASLFAQGVDLSGTEVALRAKTDLLFYVVTPDDIEAYDVAEELRAGVRHKRQRYVDDARMRTFVELLKNRNALAAAPAEPSSDEAEMAQLKARIAELESVTVEHLDGLKERVLRPIYRLVKERDATIAILNEWAETVFRMLPSKLAELDRLRKDRVADTDSMRIMLEEVDNLISAEVKDEHEARLATLVTIVSNALMMMSVSGNPEEAQVAFKALSELFTFKMKMGKSK